LRVECGASVTLSQGAKGAFEVLAEGRLVHSKLETGLVPRAERIVEILRST
jgi:selT/selW/selH-like putative selenoprotein